MIYANENGNIIEAKCEECGRILQFQKNMLHYDNLIHEYILPDPVECFCGNVSDSITNVPEQSVAVSASNESSVQENTEPRPVVNVPRCPTCGSERVKKISFTSRAVSGYFLGVFGSNFSHTYECLNCGYKW